MSLSNLMVYPIDATFQNGKVTLDSVRADARAVLTPDLFLLVVVHLIVLLVSRFHYAR
jgi:hypothetical protein